MKLAASSMPAAAGKWSMAAASFEPCSGCAKTRDRLVAGRCLFGFESDDLHFGGREEGCEGWLEDMEDGEQHA